MWGSISGHVSDLLFLGWTYPQIIDALKFQVQSSFSLTLVSHFPPDKNVKNTTAFKVAGMENLFAHLRAVEPSPPVDQALTPYTNG